MKTFIRWVLWSLVMVSLLALTADRSPQVAADAMPLARVMPSGALAYAQARNLAAQFGTWRTSETHNRYFAGDSYRAFTHSRLYIKLQDRMKEFEQGLGFGLTEDRLVNLAGGESAVSLYDMGKLELVYVTEMPAAQATATVLYKQAARFEARKRGASDYYVQELANDGGRLRQGLCFAAVGGKFIVATTEPLMHRTLDNLANLTAADHPDRLSDSMTPTLTVADGFTPHDLTLWTDVPRLRAQKFFGLYWIQGSQASLGGVAATLADLEFSQAGVREHRWSLLTEEAARTASKSVPDTAAVTNLMRFAPADAQGIEIFAVSSESQQANLTQTVARLMFPPPAASTPPQNLPSSPTDQPAGSGEDDVKRFERYHYLDQRFDQDVDDPGAVKSNTTTPRPSGPTPQQQADEQLEKALGEILGRTEPKCFARLGSGQSSAGTPFIHLNRAVVVEIKSNFDAQRFEALVAGTLRTRLLVGGATQSMEWKTEAGGVRVPPAGLVEQGGAYRLVDKYLIIANSPAYCAALAAGYQAKPTPRFAPEMEAVEHFAWLRLDAGAPSYRKLMGKLEYVPKNAPEAMTGGEGEGESGGDSPDSGDAAVPFLSGNLGSLLDVVRVGDVTVEASRNARRVEERLSYRYAAESKNQSPKPKV